ncbi:MAG TPA: sigma-70 family RNA polymerase sigma factor [Solirubrobacteraceae bacterium]
MSPLTVRRYRAERMLRKEFEGLRGRVMGTVRRRLRASGASLDASDLEACYAQAWQGLYAAMLAGEEIANPTGWLVLVTYRRAIEEHRSRRRDYPMEGVGEPGGFRGARGSNPGEPAQERDFAEGLDDRIRLRQVFEGLRGRLGERELQAAALCYLQGLTRAEAAARMGISERRMCKLMEGPGPGRPGVAGKVGELVEIVRGGGWCAEQDSLMRGFAFGILDPAGERYQLALLHRRECPACRAYVLSLRGLASVLPAPMFMPGMLGLGTLAQAGAGVGAGAGAQVGAGAGAGTAAGVQAGSGIGGAVAASGGAGAGAAGGGWVLVGGSVGAKLAVGCLVALSVGAGCVALTVGPVVHRHAVHRRRVTRAVGVSGRGVDQASVGGVLSSVATPLRVIAPPSLSASRPLVPAAKASREFGPEQAFARTSSPSAPSPSTSAAASVSSSSSSSSSSSQRAPSAQAAFNRQAASQQPAPSASATASSTGGDAAQREFGVG